MTLINLTPGRLTFGPWLAPSGKLEHPAIMLGATVDRGVAGTRQPEVEIDKAAAERLRKLPSFAHAAQKRQVEIH